MAKGLKNLPNIVVTPHTASATRSSLREMTRLVAENLLAILDGEHVPNCVNPEVYTQNDKELA